MNVFLAFVVGVLAARALVFALADVLASPLLDRENYRGHHLPTAAGLVIVLAVIVVEGLRAAAGALGIGDESPGAARPARARRRRRVRPARAARRPARRR